MKQVRIGSRGSALALAQAHWVRDQLVGRHREMEVEIRVIRTSGDRFRDRPIAAVGGKGVFTKEIEEALLRGEIDLAVHSMKDLPAELPEGLILAAVPLREDARDVLVIKKPGGFEDLAPGARLGTGSLRRQAQLLYRRRDLIVTPIRGNIDTRLKKLDEGEVDGLVMAAAGLKRIGRADRITEFLPDEVCVSAVAQGALAIETRRGDRTAGLVAFLHDGAAWTEVSAERALLGALGGGCHVPLGARARLEGERLTLIAAVASTDGSELYREQIAGTASDAVSLGERLADRLIGEGAGRFLPGH